MDSVVCFYTPSGYILTPLAPVSNPYCGSPLQRVFNPQGGSFPPRSLSPFSYRREYERGAGLAVRPHVSPFFVELKRATCRGPLRPLR